MTVQIIGEGWGHKSGFDGIVQSPLSSPRALDEFDINIISLNDEDLWKNDKDRHDFVNSSNHLASVSSMVKNRLKSIRFGQSLWVKETRFILHRLTWQFAIIALLLKLPPFWVFSKNSAEEKSRRRNAKMFLLRTPVCFD